MSIKRSRTSRRLDSINSLIINGINYPEDCKTKKYILEKNPNKRELIIYY